MICHQEVVVSCVRVGKVPPLSKGSVAISDLGISLIIVMLHFNKVRKNYVKRKTPDY